MSIDEYRNIGTGMLNAPEHIRRVYETRDSRYIAEALLTDPLTPYKVFSDLFGWTNPEDPDLYRNFFFNIPKDLPRIELVRFIKNLPDFPANAACRKELLKEVFDGGWELLDERYNKSLNVEIKTLTHKYLRKLFAGMLPNMVNSAIRSKSDAELFNKAFKALKDSASLEISILRADKELGEGHEQLRLSFVEDVQAEGQKSKDLASRIYGMSFDELSNMHKPEDVIKDVEGASVQTIIADFQEAEIIDASDQNAKTKK